MSRPTSQALTPTDEPPPSVPPHVHKSVGVYSRGPCEAPRITVCSCGATKREGFNWTQPPGPHAFDTLPAEQRAELQLYAEWLRLPKPKVPFEIYRAEHLPDPRAPLPSGPPPPSTLPETESFAALLDVIMDDHAETAHRLQALYDRQREAPDPEWWAPQSLVKRLGAEVASLSAQLERLKAELSSQTWDEALASEMIAQAELGNMRFCLGYHEHENGEVENEWIDWSEAFAKLRRLSQSDTGDTNG